MLTRWWKKQKLYRGIRQYGSAVKTLNRARERFGDDGRLPEELHHYVSDLLKLRKAWLVQIEHLENIGVLTEDEALAMRREVGD